MISIFLTGLPDYSDEVGRIVCTKMSGYLNARLICHECFINIHGFYYIGHKKDLLRSLKNKQSQFPSQQNSDNNTSLVDCNEIWYIYV